MSRQWPHSQKSWDELAAAILADHEPITDRADSVICKLCGKYIHSHTQDEQEPASPEEEETLF